MVTTNKTPGTGLLSSPKNLALPLGRNFNLSDASGGYYIDFRAKAPLAQWPPPGGVANPGLGLYVVLTQWALGCYEHFIERGDERWLAAATRGSDFLIEAQEGGGVLDGGWLHGFDYPHTFPLRAPWVSAMAQGQAASLLIRSYQATGREHYANAAQRALSLVSTPSSRGGAMAMLDGRPFPEEYPTDPPSFVLNGGIFAIWGYHDVGRALGDAAALAAFEHAVDTVASALHRWDTGSWSRYDLFPHPVVNVASPFYHQLHIDQLTALESMSGQRALGEMRSRFEDYAAQRAKRVRALGRKALFRAVVPRSRRLSVLLPWAPRL